MDRVIHKDQQASAQSRLLGHTLHILDCLINSPRSLGVSEIASELDLAKSTCHRLLNAMVDQQIVQKEPHTKRYSLNPVVFSYIHRLATHFGPIGGFIKQLRKMAKELNLSLYVSVLCGGNTYVIAASGKLGDSFALGEQAPVYASSVGKVLVAHFPQEKWKNFAPDNSSIRLTKYTNLDPEKFYKELERSLKSGVAWNNQESSLEAISVASPILEPGRMPRFAVAILQSQKELSVFGRAEREEIVKKVSNKLEVV